MATVKLTVQRGRTAPKDVGIAPGTAEAQSDTVSLNVDYTRAGRGDVLLMLDQAKIALLSGKWPPLADGALSISGSLSSATVGTSPAFTPSISGGTPPYTLSLASGTLPAGRSISGASVAGTYSTAGSYSYTLRVTDALSATATLPVGPVIVSAASGGASLSAIDTGGIYATWAAGMPPTFTPDTSPVTVSATRASFTATAGSGNTVATSSLTENRIVVQRLRQAAPNDGTPTADQVVLDDYVLASDSVGGLTSTLTGWKPIAKHRYAPRRLITGDYPVAVSADHRDGIAAVVFSVTDGATTLTQTVTDPVVANRTGDKGAVQEYQYTFLAAAMAALSGRITRNTKIYPRIGVAANVLNSADQTVETRSFCDQYDVIGPKWVIYVDSAVGSDSTGVARPMSDDATAAASPVASIKGAIERARVLMPGNRVSGLEIRLRAGNWSLSAVAFNTYQDANSAEVVLTRDPAVAKANVTFTIAAAIAWYLIYLRVQDINVVRTANVFMGSQLGIGTGGQVVFRDCPIDLGGFASAILNRPHYYEGNSPLSGVVGTALTGTGMCWMQRGVSAGALGGTTINADCWDIAACDYPNVSVVNSAGTPENETFIEGSFLRTNASGGTGGVTLAATAGATVTGIVMRNIVIEYYGAVANTGCRISADGNGSNTEHVVLRGVTVVGADNAGRCNFGYDESSGTTRRTHRGWLCHGLLAVQLNNKSDRFVANRGDTTEAPFRTGGWAVMYGAGFRGTLAYYPNAGRTASFMQDYPGLAAKIANDAASPFNPLFTDNRATTITGGTPASPTYGAGAGGGTYSVAANSPAKGMYTGGRNKFDILGNVRPASDTAGAYA